MLDAEKFISVVFKLPPTNFVLKSGSDSDAFIQKLKAFAVNQNVPFYTLDFSRFKNVVAALQSKTYIEIQKKISGIDDAFIIYFKDADMLETGCSATYSLRTFLETERYTANRSISIFGMKEDAIRKVFCDENAPFFNSHHILS